ncbi:HutD family protein [Luteimonas sp. MC1825]|uniref:HutD/Ves family protein n=1 Tax=Luteimonas sp. MC1825 TaxID=2761107 RepID=UPI00160798E3|nr:HutD family protein [Luteimonas sp. MC1825]MBB6598606.1 HutD family protein [Luteimonas sp. MC1825]QOC88783.1 HutD family protein [Luteimonas sp. MC1825]
MQPPAAHARHLPANEYRRVRWHNGGGWTREIHAEGRGGGGPGEDWDWRLSIAEITADGDFSRLAGVEREQVLLSGDGLQLRFDGNESGAHALLPPHGRLRFSGGRAAHCKLVGMRAEVFNLMWRPQAVAAQLWHRPLVGAMVVFVDPGTCWAAYLVAGQATVSGSVASPLRLAMGDTVLLGAGAQRCRHVLDGGGEVLLVRLEPAADAQ